MLQESGPVPQHLSVKQVLKDLKRRQNSLYNCLHSIAADARFVAEISRVYEALPVLANLRCGLWYTPRPDGACYFKSTDGHAGNWSFSYTRLNLHVAHTAASRGGCLVVDATRRGKSFPDSLSKTIPIWAATLNRAIALTRAEDASGREPHGIELFQHGTGGRTAGRARCSAGDESSCPSWDTSLHLPPWIPHNERLQIEGQLDAWARRLLEEGANIASLAAAMRKPLRPMWVSHATRMWLNDVVDTTTLGFTPLVLVSASTPDTPQACTTGAQPFTYVPGAGDDEESWARGLTPPVFWQHEPEMLAAGPSQLHELVPQLMHGAGPVASRAGGEGKLAAKDWDSPSSDQDAGACTGCGAAFTSAGESKHPRTPLQPTSPQCAAPLGCRDEQALVGALGPACDRVACPLAATGLTISSHARASAPALWQDVDAVLDCGERPHAGLADEVRTVVEALPAAPPNHYGAPSLPIIGKCSLFASQHLAGMPTRYLWLPVRAAKLERHALQGALPAALAFAAHHLGRGRRLLVMDEGGTDACVCIAVAVLLACSEERSAQLAAAPDTPGGAALGLHVSKVDVRRRLGFVAVCYPDARPSRGSLKQVFNFFQSV